MNPEDIRKEVPARLPAQPFNIDLKRVLFRSIRYWHVFLIALSVALAVAYFNTRYAVRIYPITASILIKEKEETSEGRLLYSNSLVNGFRNYLNELYLIKSYPIIQRTVEDLNFGIAFYNEGNVLTTEIYHPQIRTTIIKNGGDHRFYLKLIDSVKYQLLEEFEGAKPKVFSLGDTVTFNRLTFVFTHDQNAEGFIPINQQVIFTYSDPSYLTGSYVAGLQVSWAEEGAGVMNLSINGSNPAKELDFLNGLIRQYQQYDLEKKNLVATRTIEFINEQLTNISDSLQQAERQLERFKNENLLTDASSEAKRLYEKIGVIETQRAELSVKESYYTYLKKYLTNEEKLDKVILPSSVGISDPILFSLVSKMVDLQLSIKTYSGLDNPLINENKRRISELRTDILESVRNQQSADKLKDDFITGQLLVFEKQLNRLPLAERKLISIQRNYALLENVYIFLLQKRTEAGISRASTTTDISIVNPPMLAGGPISPKPMINYLAAIALGLGLPTLLFVLLELFNSKVQSKEDVEKVTTIPFTGGVGHKSGENNLEVLTSPKTSIAESFRALRSNLNYFLGQRDQAVIMITSSISGEGKTFTTLNLASVISLSGKKVLIVGADMRKPKLFSDFRLVNDVGLSTYLAGITDFETIVQKTSYLGIDLVSGGSVPPNPAELLLTEKMSDFLKEAKKRYDFIIIDTPPLAIVSDAFSLAEFADHTLFVIRQNYTPISLLRTLEDSYRLGKLKNVSIVLNDIHVSGPGYGYGYGYGFGYGYVKSNKRYGQGYYSE